MIRENKTSIFQYVKVIFNLLGLASLCGNVFLAFVVFFSIVNHGYAFLYEPNIISTLYPEFALACFSGVYTGFLVQKYLRATIFRGTKEAIIRVS